MDMRTGEIAKLRDEVKAIRRAIGEEERKTFSDLFTGMVIGLPKSTIRERLDALEENVELLCEHFGVEKVTTPERSCYRKVKAEKKRGRR